MRRPVTAAGHLASAAVRRLSPITSARALVVLASLALPVVAAVCLVASLAAGPGAAATRSSAAAALEVQIGDLDAQLDRAVSEYGTTAQRLARLQADVRQTRDKRRQVRYDLLVAKAALRTRLVAIYKERPVDLLDVVMGSASFDEFLGKLTLMKRLGVADARLIESTDRLERQLSREQRGLVEELVRMRVSLAAVDWERVRLASLLADRRSLLGELRRVAATRAQAKARPSPRPTHATDPPADVSAQGGWWPAVKAAAGANGIDARGLYRLMMVESGGVATADNGHYKGLFQYSVATWRASWNLWRNASIFDGAAQIKATARAVRLGLGPRMWPNTFGYAFSGQPQAT